MTPESAKVQSSHRSELYRQTILILSHDPPPILNMVSLRGAKKVYTSSVASKPSPKPSNNKTKKRTSSNSEDKENKRRKPEASDGSPAHKENAPNTAEKISIQNPGDSTPNKCSFPSVEKTEQSGDSKKHPNPFPEDCSKEAHPTEERRDRRPTPGCNYEAFRDPKFRLNLGDDPGLIERKIATLDDKIARETRKAAHREGPKPPVLKALKNRWNALADPHDLHHCLQVCFAKGPKGSPTYDENGFELDYHTGAQFVNPDASKCRRVRVTTSFVEKADRWIETRSNEEKEMAEIFWEPGAGLVDFEWSDDEGIIRDKVSKDLGVPWHKVWLKEFQEWEEKGFRKAKLGEYTKTTPGERTNIRDLVRGLLSGSDWVSLVRLCKAEVKAGHFLNRLSKHVFPAADLIHQR